ncbi:phage terminase large subunit [Bacillus licheniformis]|uniref:phage terminase large subunit n=1 Tax=Bacillus licheniformis TaxID=1402 RepID=UPI001BDE2D6E|nr:phage terminase large subunit [Bacillus licheniformis]MBT1249440.1 phage terminase large subunit [Bacillus licheniformis]MCY9236787.1 phage terminase large subunit [Bacillus licheniformis]MED1523868.1 phage terminase large subunit [Bacillus licheniformis]MED4930376.1 phage terminase large subunit [Bacillus licheniformis]
MAYVDGKWLDREERQERIDLLTERVRKLVALIKAGKATEYHIDTFRKDKAELTKLKRIHRSEVDMLYFFYEYFSEARNPGNPDNLVPTAEVDMNQAPDFHVKLSRILDSVSNKNRTARIAWAASRGHAKSAYLSNAFPVHEIVFRKRKMILIISETNAGSKKFIKWVANQLKYNLKLRDDFGVLLHEQKTRNEKDSEEAFLTTTGIKMEATSLGTQIRGFRNGSQRPDLIILDDLESRDSNNTAELRQKAKDWLNQDLMPAYDPTQTAVIFMGTLVHHDSLLNYVLNERRDFIKNKFPAIVSMPERMDLWAEFERIYREYDPTEEELAEMETADEEKPTPNARAALEYFEENREDMEKGVEVLWPSRFPITQLMLEKVNYGTKAFNTEFMNNPIDEESQLFKPETFCYYENIEFTPKKYDLYMGVDFAMGKERGDYSAVVTVAKHKSTGKIYVVDAWGDRVHPDVFLRVILNKVKIYQPSRIAAESQMAQEFFIDTLKRELQLEGYPAHSRVTKIQQRSRKELRIEALLQLIENGTLVFNRNHTLLLEQFERYGSRWYDDLPDALEMAVSISKRSKSVLLNKPQFL